MSSVGQALGGIVGAVVGFSVGGPTGALYGAQIGMGVGGIIDPPKGPTIRGPRLDDLSVQTSTYGAFIPRNYGTVAQLGNVFWLQGDKLTEVANTASSGGKGGPQTTTQTWSYYATFAVGLCEGPISGVRRIWIGADLFYDAQASTLDQIIASNQAAQSFTIYTGTDTQLPDPTIQADKGVANVPAYRGLAYIVFHGLALEKYGNSLIGAQVKVEIVSLGSTGYVSSTKTIPIAWPYNQWRDVASDGNSTMVATAISSGLAAVTLDGETWSSSTMPSSADWTCVAYGAGVFVAIGGTSGKTALSTNGINWITGYTLPALDFRRIVWNGTVFLAIAFQSSRVFTSVNGKDWVEGAFPATPYAYWNDVAWNGSVFCAIYNNSDIAAISPDGLSWVLTTLPATSYWTSIASDGVGFVAISGVKVIAYSTDGVTWTGGTSMVLSSGSVSGVGVEWVIRHNGDAYIVATGSSNKYLISQDAAIWDLYYGVQTMAAIPAIGSYQGIFCSVPVNGPAEFIYPKLNSSVASLGDIVEAECIKSNLLSASDIDRTALTDSVRGYRISSLGAIRSGIDPLRAAWPFDVVQHGYKIRFVRRGGASVATIPAADLDARGAGETNGISVNDVREMDSVLPRKVTLKYLDVVREYDTNEQFQERSNTDAVNETVVELPIVFNATEAKQKVETLLYLYWMERNDVSLRLPPTYEYLEPGDVVAVTGDYATYELRLNSVNYLPDGRLECRAKYNKASIYTPVSNGEEGLSTGSVLTLAGNSVYIELDIPLMRDSDDRSGFPVAMTGYLAGWPGGILYRSDDGGQTWVDLQAWTAPGTVMGYATNTLSAHGGTVYDFSGQLALRLYGSGALASVTETQLFAGQNWFAYGADGRWEIIAARKATLQGDGSYVLSDLLRGQMGTEWATGTHAIGDSVVLLDANALHFIDTTSASIGSAKIYRGITVGASLTSDTDRSFAYNGVNLKCLSPVALTGSRHPSTNDWTLAWTRRSRYAGWRDYIDAPLGEASESYDVEIWDAGYATLKRTFAGLTSPTTPYTSAQQVADFGSNQATLYIKVFQNSATVGRGYALTQSITR